MDHCACPLLLLLLLLLGLWVTHNQVHYPKYYTTTHESLIKQSLYLLSITIIDYVFVKWYSRIY